MKNIKRLVMVMTVVFALFNLLAVQSKAAEWKEDEVVDLIKTKINKYRFDDLEKNNKLEAEIEKSLEEDRAKYLYAYMGVLLIISIIICVVAIKAETPKYILGAAILWLTVVPVYKLIFNGFPSEEDVAKRKAELGIEATDETEVIKKTIKEVIDEIYTAGDTINSYSIEEATEEITRKIEISEGKVLKYDK